MDDDRSLTTWQEKIKKGDMAVVPCRQEEVEPIRYSVKITGIRRRLRCNG